ncbi:MAG: hypothetical protein N3F07_03990 [Candidatus Micrarchaeota archaeon]|nr:hypothetical protein [Candidatus Micrarchaeota archaeon]
MASQLFELEDEYSLNRMIITMSSQLLLVCATVLVFFAYLQPPIFLATAACLLVFFAGSVFCWKSLASAQTILLLSLLTTQFILMQYFDYLLVPFLLLDIFLVLAFARSWNPKED